MVSYMVLICSLMSNEIEHIFFFLIFKKNFSCLIRIPWILNRLIQLCVFQRTKVHNLNPTFHFDDTLWFLGWHSILGPALGAKPYLDRLLLRISYRLDWISEETSSNSASFIYIPYWSTLWLKGYMGSLRLSLHGVLEPGASLSAPQQIIW